MGGKRAVRQPLMVVFWMDDPGAVEFLTTHTNSETLKIVGYYELQ
jgi:hypothetical protein